MLTNKQKGYLRSLANGMHPIIQVGKDGLNEGLLETIKNALEARELIKISILQNCSESQELLVEEISKASGSEIVQKIGRILILYKKSENSDNQKISNTKIF